MHRFRFPDTVRSMQLFRHRRGAGLTPTTIRINARHVRQCEEVEVFLVRHYMPMVCSLRRHLSQEIMIINVRRLWTLVLRLFRSERCDASGKAHGKGTGMDYSSAAIIPCLNWQLQLGHPERFLDDCADTVVVYLLARISTSNCDA